MADDSIRTQVARDRKRAGILGWISILVVSSVFAVFIYVTSLVAEYYERSYFIAVAAGSVLLCAVVARWNFNFIRSRLVRPRVEAMWLRRFQAESGHAFRTSRVIDQLARYGISTLTLQDRDVRLSLEQRHQRLAPIFWALSVPLTAGLALLLFPLWQFALRSATTGGFQNLGEMLGLTEGVIWVTVILAIAASLAEFAGPIGALFRRHRDDYPKLPRLIRRVKAGRRKRGAVVLRISDDHWRDTVTTALGTVDVALVDVSSVNEHIAWEIREAANACGAEALVFLCKENPEGLSPQAAKVIGDVIGPELPDIVYYPQSRYERRRGHEFAIKLRQAIYITVDRRSAHGAKTQVGIEVPPGIMSIADEVIES